MRYTFQEHQEKKLISGDIIENVGVIKKIKPEAVQKLTESAKGKQKRKLIVQMEAIHVGRTANYTFYTAEGLKNGLSSWTHPYNKPVLTHHNDYSGEPIGRILKAEYAETTLSGREGLIFTCEITDPDAIEKVLDGRYQTVSIGASTDKVTCNICGTDRTKEWCDHWRGEEYEGVTCHYVIGTTYGREVSYVNVPADQDAKNFSVRFADEGEDDHTKESVSLQMFQIAEGLMQNVNMPEVNLYESASEDVKRLVDGLLKVKEEGSVSNMGFRVNEQGQIVDKDGKVLDIEEMTKAQSNLKEAQKELESVKSQLQEAQATLLNVVTEKQKVDAKLEEAQEEINRLTSENAELIEKAHRALAEKVVDMKMILRKSDVVGVSYEEAVEDHIKRSEESLKDTIKDLQTEMKDTTAIRGVIKNPGFSGEDHKPGETEEKMTIEDAVNMFKGMFSRKS